MLVPQADVFDVPAAESTLVTLSENSSYGRVFFFENLTANTLRLAIQETDDGGSTWTDVGETFTVGPAEQGGEVEVKLITSSNQLRIRASGGLNDRDLLITQGRYYLRGPSVLYPAT